MATEDQILELRTLVNETAEGCEWTDEELGAAIDSTETMNGAASKVWYLKAGRFSTLVDVSESGSSRKLGDLYKNALAMGKYYGDADQQEEDVVVDVPIVRRIRRTVA